MSLIEKASRIVHGHERRVAERERLGIVRKKDVAYDVISFGALREIYQRFYSRRISQEYRAGHDNTTDQQ